MKSEFNTPKNIIPIDNKEIIRYEVKQIENYTNLEYLLSALDPAEMGICYVSHISTMKNIEAKARELGFHPISFWSVSNTNHLMNQEQMNVRETILKAFIIPPQYDLLIINASSETSLKIKSPVDYVIVHSNDYDTQVQVRGRVNNDLTRLYLPTNDPDALTVPAEYLNRPLFSKDKTELCEIINLRNPYNRRFRWTTIHSMLLDCDYCVSEGRRNDKRYAIITLPAE